MFCTNCGNEITDDTVFCPKCGAKTGNETAAAIKTAEGDPAAPAAKATATATVVVEKDDGDDWYLPVVTLLTYVLIYPIGLVLNIVGFFSGKHKGCFLSMFIVFFLIPLIVSIIVFFILVCIGAAAAAA